MRKYFFLVILFPLVCFADVEKTEITVVLDWYPNTNHTGLYVAKELGFYQELGLDVSIRQFSAGGSPDLVALGKAAFGISYQEQVIYATSGKTKLDILAIAAILRENTSGFVSLAHKNITSPKDFEGKKYGGWGSPMEKAVVASLMNKVGADTEKITFLNIGTTNIFEASASGIDFTWVFFGWDGIEAKLAHQPINFILLQDVVPQLNSYTPLIITSQKLATENSKLVKRFVQATKRGYIFAINNPQEAAEILLKYAPELKRELVFASQKYLSEFYAHTPDSWGEMEHKVWENYKKWMEQQGLIKEGFDVSKTFTNRFLD